MEKYFTLVMFLEEKEFWEDIRWIEENYAELQKQFKDKWVAIVGKKVVSYGEKSW